MDPKKKHFRSVPSTYRKTVGEDDEEWYITHPKLVNLSREVLHRIRKREFNPQKMLNFMMNGTPSPESKRNILGPIYISLNFLSSFFCTYVDFVLSFLV